MCETRRPVKYVVYRKREYPLEQLLNGIDRALFQQDRCEVGCDPCGYDLWPCVGHCPDAHGAPVEQGVVLPPTPGPTPPPPVLDPENFRQPPDEEVNPFRDDPDQPPRPPITPASIRSARR